MIVVIKQWFVIIAMNIDHARAFEEIMYLLFNSLGWPTMLVSYILKKNPQHFNMKFTWILQDNLDFGSEHLHGNIKTYYSYFNILYLLINLELHFFYNLKLHHHICNIFNVKFINVKIT